MRASRTARERYASPIGFAAAIGCLLLPFVSISLDERRASATGFQLVANRPTFHGRYVQLAYAGEAETLIHHAAWPARLVLAACVVGACSILLTRRRARQASLWAAIAALVLLFVLRFVSASRFHPPYSSCRAGFWLCAVVLFAVAVWNVRSLRRDEDDGVGLGWPIR